MLEIVSFIYIHRWFSALMLITNILINIMVIKKICLKSDKIITEAKGRRAANRISFKKYTKALEKYAGYYEGRYEKSKIFNWGELRAKSAGFEGEFVALKYLILQIGFPITIFIILFLNNFPSVKEGLKGSILALILIEILIRRRKRNLEVKLQKYGYKIYKYLHNQISSGIKVTDAIKTVYQVIEDRGLKKVLLRLSAKYELTLDIDGALEEFISVYNSQEGESFCIAIKQGILTGDNQDLLARQEDIMFKKYFNQIQAETDNMKTRGVFAAIVFTAIIVMMVIIPFFFDAANALEKMFSS